METLSARSADGTALHLRRWPAEGRKLGSVLVVHGLAEHFGRYEHVAGALTRAGFEATVLELRGHGASEGRRGHVDSWGQYEADLRAAAALMGEPFFIVAHSMGGLVTMSTLLGAISPKVKGVALSNPLFGVAVKAPVIKVKAARLLSRVLPKLPLTNEIDVSALSRDQEVGRVYLKDPKVFNTITPRWFTEATAAMDRVTGGAASYRYPLLMLIGTGDRICAHPVATSFFDRYGGEKEKVVFPDYYHELFNEPEKEEVLAVVTRWLQRREGEQTEPSEV